MIGKCGQLSLKYPYSPSYRNHNWYNYEVDKKSTCKKGSLNKTESKLDSYTVDHIAKRPWTSGYENKITLRKHKRSTALVYMNLPKPTKKKPIAVAIHRLRVKGWRKENIPGFFFSGFFIIMLIPTFINGLEKSTTNSRSLVIDNGAMAMSASWNQIILT